MPSEKNQNINLNDPVEKIKDFLGISWTKIILILIGLTPTAFITGMKAGKYFAQQDYNTKLIEVSLKHQKELYDEKNKGRQQALDEIKQANEQVKLMYDIINGSKNKKEDR